MDGVEDASSMFNSANNSPPPFLNKTYEMVDDPSTNSVVSWSDGDNSFVVWNVPEFSRDLLPKYFKHNNFSSFVRQLNTYGFRKVDPDRWEFANEGFLRGQKHLLKTVSRRRPAHVQSNPQPPPKVQSSQVGACVEVGYTGLEEEVESLKRDKNSLMQELVRLRQQQQATDHQLHVVGQRVQGMEQRQQQMMSFLAKTMQSPGFLSQLVQHQNDSRLITGGNKKRRLPRQEDEILVGKFGTKILDGQMVKYQPSMNEAAKAMLRQILKMNTSPRLEPSIINPDAFLIDNVPSSNALDSGNNYNGSLGVTLSEVPPTSAECYTAEESGKPASCNSTAISQSFPYAVTNCVKTNQVLEENMHNFQEVTVMPEITQMQGTAAESTAEIPNASFMSSENGHAGYMDMSTVMDGTFPTGNDGFSPEPDVDALLNGASNLPGITDIFWEQFLMTSPLAGDTDETTLSSVDDQELKLGQENGWDKNQHMNHITEQMELLASGSQIG